MGKIVRGYAGKPAGRGPVDWPRLKAEICDRLDVGAEYAALGVVFTAPGPNPAGWRACHAYGRIGGGSDDRPSAAVKIMPGDPWHGVYTDHGGTFEKHGFFDFALLHGKFKDFSDCIHHYASKAGVVVGIYETSGKNIVECIYLYRNADGTVSYGVFRMRTPKGGKDFRQYPWRDGAWFKASGCMAGVVPLPYRLPELLAAPTTATVHIVEGEKDVERLMSLGLVATTNHQGAKSTDKTWPHFVHYFAGWDVVVHPDNDPAGRIHMNRVCELLNNVAGRVRWCDLPGTGPGGDVSDWLDGGGTLDGLRRLVAQSPDWKPGIYAPAAENGATGSRGALHAIGLAGKTGENGQVGEDTFLGEFIGFGGIMTKKMRWLIPDKIPLGMITLLTGMPDLGKSLIATDIVARLSVGGEIPGCPGENFVPARSLIFSAEESLEYVIKPRLVWAGADPSMVGTFKMLNLGDGVRVPFTLTHLEQLDYCLRDRPDHRFVVIDPITSYLGTKTDTNRDTEIRAIMEPLNDVAERRDVAIVVISHLNKGNSPDAIHRISGSGAFGQLARASWFVFRDRDDKERALFLSLKNNLTPNKRGLAYRIDGHDGARIVWEADPVEITAQEYVNELSKAERGGSGGGKRGRPAKSREEAVAFLQEYLRMHGAVRSDDVLAAAKAAGFGRDIVWEVKDVAGIRAKQQWTEAAGNQWFWKLGDFPGSNGDRFP